MQKTPVTQGPLMRYLFIVTIVLALAGCSGGHKVDGSKLEASSAALARTIDFDKPDFDALATAMELMTNEVRVQNGLRPLDTHPVLRRASARYAQKMVKEEFLAHEDPNSPKLRTPEQRVAAAGGKNAAAAENIADVPAFRVESGEPFYVIDAENYVIAREPGGPPIEPHTYASYAATVVEGWMNSPGHRRNLLADDALEQGIGAQMYIQNTVPAFIVVQKFQLRAPLQ